MLCLLFHEELTPYNPAKSQFTPKPDLRLLNETPSPEFLSDWQIDESNRNFYILHSAMQ